MLMFFSRYGALIVAAAIGTLGYCLVFNVKRDKIIYGCIGGILSTFLYFACVEAGWSLLIQNMIPAAVVTLYSEILARVVKAPATVFLIPSIIPLVPGGKLYYTMSAMVDGNDIKARIFAEQTLIIAVGIAVGIVIVSLIFYHISHKNIRYKVRFGADLEGKEGPNRSVSCGIDYNNHHLDGGKQ